MSKNQMQMPKVEKSVRIYGIGYLENIWGHMISKRALKKIFTITYLVV